MAKQAHAKIAQRNPIGDLPRPQVAHYGIAYRRKRITDKRFIGTDSQPPPRPNRGAGTQGTPYLVPFPDASETRLSGF